MKSCVFNPMTHVVVEHGGVTYILEHTPGYSGDLEEPPGDAEFQVLSATVTNKDDVFARLQDEVLDAARAQLKEERANLELERNDR